MKLSDVYPPLKEWAVPQLVCCMGPMVLLQYLIPLATIGASSSYALVFRDAEGNAISLADATYTVYPSSEGRHIEPDESMKTTAGVTILSKDYAGSAANFTNALNVLVVGRLSTQPAA